MNPPNSKACFTSTAMSEGKRRNILLEKKMGNSSVIDI